MSASPHAFPKQLNIRPQALESPPHVWSPAQPLRRVDSFFVSHFSRGFCSRMPQDLPWPPRLTWSALGGCPGYLVQGNMEKPPPQAVRPRYESRSWAGPENMLPEKGPRDSEKPRGFREGGMHESSLQTLRLLAPCPG